MSYGSKPRTMREDDDLMFRVKISYKTNEEIRSFYKGPYMNVGSARGQLTQAKRYNKTATSIELEACMPIWKVME